MTYQGASALVLSMPIIRRYPIHTLPWKPHETGLEEVSAWVRALCAQNPHREVIEENRNKENDCTRAELNKEMHSASKKNQRSALLHFVSHCIGREKLFSTKQKSCKFGWIVRITCR